MSDRVAEEVFVGNDGVEHMWSTLLRRDRHGKYEVVLRGHLLGHGWQNLALLSHSNATREDALENAAYNIDQFRMELLRISDAMKGKAREAEQAFGKKKKRLGSEVFDRKKKAPDVKTNAAGEGAETKRWEDFLDDW